MIIDKIFIAKVIMAIIWLGQTIHVNVKMEELQEKHDALVEIVNALIDFPLASNPEKNKVL